MKIIVFFIAIFGLINFSNAQMDTKVRIYHRLGNQSFSLNSNEVNNINKAFNFTRMEYYLSRFSIVYNGGSTLVINDSVLALINLTNEDHTDIDLGMLNVSNIDSIKFHVGVYAPINNGDPAAFSSSHPLGPKSPSMHWGWASGYRFAAIEGKSGSNFTQTFQLHGLFNENYFETSVPVNEEIVGGTMFMAITADYLRSLENIDMNTGPVAHGTNTEDLIALENFRDFVFSPSAGTITANIDVYEESEFLIYPNPLKAGNLNIRTDDASINNFQIMTMDGRVVALNILNAATNLDLSYLPYGTYIILFMSNENVVAQKRFVKL